MDGPILQGGALREVFCPRALALGCTGAVAGILDSTVARIKITIVNPQIGIAPAIGLFAAMISNE